MHPINLSQHLDQFVKIWPHQRLTAGQSIVRHTQFRRDSHKLSDLIKAQQSLIGHEGHVAIRHAVLAADVAYIGNTDAQRPMHALKPIH
jgi:hypothetical protein